MNNLWSACALTVCDYLQCAPSVPFHECSIYKYFLFWLWGHDWKHLTSVSQCWICKFSFMHVLETALVDTAGLILEDRVICLAFCWKDVIILIGLGTHLYCRCVVCTHVAGNEQELWESATFHSKPHEYCVYLNKNYNFFPKFIIWEMGLTLKSCGELGVLFISMFLNIQGCEGCLSYVGFNMTFILNNWETLNIGSYLMFFWPCIIV